MSVPLELGRDAGGYTGARDGEVVTVVRVSVSDSIMRVLSTHTAAAHRGQGHAEQVTRSALEDARARGLRVVPICPYTVEFVATHPEYADLLAR